MEKEDKYNKAYKKRMKHVWTSVYVQIIFVVIIVIFALVNAWSGLYGDAQKTSDTASIRTNDIIEGYKNSFKGMIIPIEDKIKENISFEEMQTWLQSKDEEFSKAVGEDAFDGIALTYKGGYAHSWDYGDYSSYDPTSRDWYKIADKANGEVALVPPYITYLSSDNQDSNHDILMSIVLKYNDEIYFDLDLKLPKIKGILKSVKTKYDSEDIFIYNSEGQIVSSTDEKVFSHNVYKNDDVISSDIVGMINNEGKEKNVLQISVVEGELTYLYFADDDNGNTICIMVPAMDIFWKNFFVIGIVCIALLLFVIYNFVKSKRSVIDSIERDHRLDVVEYSDNKFVVYVDLSSMTFYGNDNAAQNASDDSYETLYNLFVSRLINSEDESELEAFMSPDNIKKVKDNKYHRESARFFMNMRHMETDELGPRTIELSKLGFVEDRKNIVEITMIDAAESVDILKAALNETEKLKEEKEDEYNRFMSYICAAQDGVEELNIKEHTITRYYVVDGILKKDTVNYPGMPFHLFHEEDRAQAHELYDEDKLAVLCDNQLSSYAELRMKWNNSNEYRYCNVIVLGMPRCEKTPFNVLVLIKDTNDIKVEEIKQRKALEDAFKVAQQGSQAKGSFLSNMSHEIRTPLNAIIGYLSIASDEDVSDEKKDYCIQSCNVASKHLLQIINDILDMSSIESGKLKIAKEEFDLKKEIEDLTAIFYQNAKAKKIGFETHINNVSEEWVIGDQLRVNQVLMNLLSNAVKFTPEGGNVTLSVEQVRKDEQKVYMKFSVSDTGIGMSEDYLSRIFSPFEQENAGTAKKFGGSGLGLSITNNLVNMMGGKIEVRSKQNEGTTFIVTMFFNMSKQKHLSEQIDYSHVRVLVVDDKDNECSYIKEMLKRCGTKVETVNSGKSALRKIRSRAGSDYEYNLCIIDWNMPEMDGCEVTRRIRQELGEEMPIIIATAYDVIELEDDALKSGANKVVAKPLFQSTLFDILVSSFGNYNPELNRTIKSKVDLKGLKVLLVEDNPMNMDIAVTILEKANIKVTQAINGKEAVDKFLASKKGDYDLILMDVQMPVMDGYEATRVIRNSNHEAKDIPIVAMTANAFAEDVATALSNGMNAHIAKPVSYDKLFEVLNKFK